MDATVQRLLEFNLQIVQEYTTLAKAVIESRIGPHILPPVPATAALPSFTEFAQGQEMTPEEKLFYSEEEEDARYEAQMFGPKDNTDPDTLKEILQAAGLEPHVQSA